MLRIICMRPSSQPLNRILYSLYSCHAAQHRMLSIQVRTFQPKHFAQSIHTVFYLILRENRAHTWISLPEIESCCDIHIHPFDIPHQSTHLHVAGTISSTDLMKLQFQSSTLCSHFVEAEYIDVACMPACLLNRRPVSLAVCYMPSQLAVAIALLVVAAEAREPWQIELWDSFLALDERECILLMPVGNTSPLARTVLTTEDYVRYRVI